MTEPVFHPVTEDAYASLPEIHRTLDAAQLPAYPLKRFLSAMTDQVGAVFDIVERADFEPVDSREDDTQATSDLVDPATAEPAWLPWLGQLVGVRVNTGLTEQAQRDQAAGAVSGFRAGTRPAIAEAARSVLTGTRHAEVYARTVSVPGDGGRWDVLIVTRASETPAGVDVVAAVIEKGAKPAGVKLRHRAYEAAWGAERPWSDFNASWQDIQERGL